MSITHRRVNSKLKGTQLMSAQSDSTWTDRQALAEQMLPLIGRLYRDNGGTRTL